MSSDDALRLRLMALLALYDLLPDPDSKLPEDTDELKSLLSRSGYDVALAAIPPQSHRSRERSSTNSTRSHTTNTNNTNSQARGAGSPSQNRTPHEEPCSASTCGGWHKSVAGTASRTTVGVTVYSPPLPSEHSNPPTN